MNAGFLRAVADTSRFTHFAFHDVDALPDSSSLLKWYATPPPPGAVYHLASPARHDRYRFARFFGSVTIFEASTFKASNGFPATFWGWGGEDDALLQRCAAGGAAVVYRPRRGRYRDLPHLQNTVEVGGSSRSHLEIGEAVVRDQCHWAEDGLGGDDAEDVAPPTTVMFDNVVVGLHFRVRLRGG